VPSRSRNLEIAVLADQDITPLQTTMDAFIRMDIFETSLFLDQQRRVARDRWLSCHDLVDKVLNKLVINQLRRHKVRHEVTEINHQGKKYQNRSGVHIYMSSHGGIEN
jgi:hypothetical protein